MFWGIIIGGLLNTLFAQQLEFSQITTVCRVIGEWEMISPKPHYDLKWVFSLDGKLKEYRNDQLKSIFFYSILKSTPNECKVYRSKWKIENYLYLKGIQDTTDTRCYEIIFDGKDSLSIRYLPLERDTYEILTRIDKSVMRNIEYAKQLINLSGTWYWNSTNEKNSFELYLSHTDPSTLEGYHCSTFYDGNKIDCVEDTEECSLNLTKIGQNIYQGTIKSGFSSTIGTVKLTYDPIHDRIHFELLTEPEGEYYIPEDVYLKK